MQTATEIKNKLKKQWQRLLFHKQWLLGELHFPWQLSLKRPSDKALLHRFGEFSDWQKQLEQDLSGYSGVSLLKQQVNYATMGRQRVPVAVQFLDIQSLARFCGKWREWQLFNQDIAIIDSQFPQLKDWQHGAVAQILKYAGEWSRLTAIAHYFIAHPKPGCYLRELPITGIDSKFIEAHKLVVKSLLDRLLPDEAIKAEYQHISDHGFEKRFGLKYDEPQIRFRLLDPQLAYEFGGLFDICIPLAAFAKLDLLIDRVFITENLTNGLAFPPVKNALVIFGKGYGIQLLKQVHWLNSCQLYYWGDIDTDGFAMLSQIRSYFPKAISLLMDEDTLIASKAFWGQEAENKKQTPDSLVYLTSQEAKLYQQLKQDHWQARLRLEQERVPFSLLQDKLNALH